MKPITPLSALAIFVFMVGCSSIPPLPTDRDTTDLAEVVEDTRELAKTVGIGNVLVVLDIDNTLLAMEQDLGSDQWYQWQKALADDEPCGPMTVPDRFAVQGAIYHASAMRPTQPDAAEQVRVLQDSGLRVIALTSRGTDYRLQTFRELRRNGYDFRRSALAPRAGWPENFIPSRGNRPARYEDGVFLTSGQHKGDMLLDLLERSEAALPTVVVTVDDKRGNLDALVEALAPLGVVVRSWHYLGEADRVAAFDPAASDSLWRSLEPALLTLQDRLGTDHYALPNGPAEPCTP